MDVAPGCVSACAANMDLIVELGKEGLGVNRGTAGAHEAAATGSHRGDLESFRRSGAVFGFRRIDLHEIGAQAKGNAGGTGDERGILLGGNRLAAGINPQHDDEAVGMSLGNEFACFGHHGGFEFGTEVNGVADTDDIHARFTHGEHGIEIVELRGIGILLLRAHDVGLGIHLHEVVDFRIVSRILGYQAALARQHAAYALAPDLEQMLGFGIGDIDSLAVEIGIEMLDLLVARKQHETAGAARGLHEVVDVLFP